MTAHAHERDIVTDFEQAREFGRRVGNMLLGVADTARSELGASVGQAAPAVGRMCVKVLDTISSKTPMDDTTNPLLRRIDQEDDWS
jgi:hypothetical protein